MGRAPLQFGLAAFAALSALILAVYPSAELSIRLIGSGSYQIFIDDGAGFSEAGSRWLLIEDSENIQLPSLGLGRGVLRIDPPPGIVFTVCEPRRRVHWLPGFAADSAIEKREALGMRLSADDDTCSSWIVDAAAPDPQVIYAFTPLTAEGPLGNAQRTVGLALWLVALASAFLGFIRLGPAQRRQLEHLSDQVYVRADASLGGIFLAFGLVLGLFYMLVRPPGAVPDEFAHSSKIALMAAGQFTGVDKGAIRPGLVGDYGPFQNVYGQKFTFEQLCATVSQPLSCAHEPLAGAMAPTASSPFMYLVPWGVHEFTCDIGASFGLYYYAAQLLNLFLYLLLAWFGIRSAGFGRWALFFFALAPMSLYLASSLSYDSAMLGLSFSYLGLVSGTYSGKVAADRVKWILFLVGLGIAASKPLAGWILFAPWICIALFGDWRSRAAWLGLTSIVPALLHGIWLLDLTTQEGPSVRPDVAAVNGMDALLVAPTAYLTTLATTATSFTGVRIFQGIVGVFGWLDTYPAKIFYYLASCAVLITLGLDSKPKRYSRWVALYSIAVAGLTILVMCAPFYAYWTPVTSPVIEGLQGRYFLPIAAFVVMGLSFSVRVWGRGLFAGLLFILIPAMSVMALQTIMHRYY